MDIMLNRNVRKNGIEKESKIIYQNRWDEIADGFRDIYPAASTKYYKRREIELINSFFGPLKDKKVLKLDLWNEAVNTRILNWMASEGADVYGFDISSITVRRAYINAQTDGDLLNVIQSDIRSFPYESNVFDFVYTMGTIEHIVEYDQTLREVSRVLKVGGKAIVGVPNKLDVFLRPLIVKGLDIFALYPYSPEKSFRWSELRQVVDESDLKVIGRSGILFMPGLLRMMDLFLVHRGINLFLLFSFLLSPFEYIEKNNHWVHFLGYLLVALAEKPSLEEI